MDTETKNKIIALEEEKLQLARIRNARAEICLIYLKRMEASVNNPELYEKFLAKIGDMESDTQVIKARVKEINRELTEFTGQEVFDGGCIPTSCSV